MNNKIKELRIQNKINQKELAEKLNTTQQAISLYEKGEREPKMEMWQKLANFFGVTVQYIQGLTYDEYSILKLMNDNYLNQPFPRSLKEKIDKYLENKHIELPLDKFSKEELTKFVPSVQNYWKNNFIFIFNDFEVKHLISYGGDNTQAINIIESVITNKYLSDNNTAISLAYNQSRASMELTQFYYHKNELMRFDNKKEINKRLEDLINSLKSFKNTLPSLPDNPERISDNDLPF